MRRWNFQHKAVVEEILFCEPMEKEATAIVSANLQLNDCVGICTVGAQAISGEYKNLQVLAKKGSPGVPAVCELRNEIKIFSKESRKLVVVSTSYF